MSAWLGRRSSPSSRPLLTLPRRRSAGGPSAAGGCRGAGGYRAQVQLRPRRINAAIADIQAGRTGPIPRQLQNKHYDGADAKVKGQHYLYPHDYPNHWTPQQYLPDAIKDRQYYVPGDNKNEQAFAQYWKKIKGEL